MRRVLLVLAVLALPARAEDFSLKEGDKVVFYGDSITAQRHYTSFVETFVATRFRSLDVRFVGSGWGGDTVRGGGGGPIDKRLARDVIAYEPTVVTIMLGMNDASYKGFDEKTFEAYKKGYEHLIETLKKALPKARLVLIEPSPYDEVTRAATVPGGYNTALQKFGAFVRELAEREQLACVDLNAPLVSCLENAKEASPELAQKIIPDRIHPAPAGHLVMAAALLEAWHAPSLVSEVSIDAKEGKAAAKGAQVAFVGSLAWTATEDALPFPIDVKDPAVALAVRSSRVAETLAQETLRVTGLEYPSCDLEIDGHRLGIFSREALEKGINLALLATPMHQQAQRVQALTRRHGDLHEQRWHMAVTYEAEKSGHLAQALHELDEFEKELIAQQREAAKPVQHKFRLIPVD